ncbi:hypothetical protein FDP41_011430 [Naegleria fowleri]|uniref:Uncharacterized protein n=1 Tax=Naegleria fowleri TaxID=5763 RepID=A0A6A5C9X2_NAEFO|nr:uncharacterized protein FDP41_011430 [Naegleria fowleri]KAF0982500.1 hypothetical protein FDP41_011430 [Naegleria fowleri]CAG4713919.1 unnamed protein product [Naegleria fowleri]
MTSSFHALPSSSPSPIVVQLKTTPSQISIHRFTLANIFKYILESPSDVHGLLLGPRSLDLSSSTWPITNFILFHSHSSPIITTMDLHDLMMDIKIDDSKYIIIGYFKYRSNTSLNSMTLNEMNILYYLLNNLLKRDSMIFALFTDRMISNESMLLSDSSDHLSTSHSKHYTTIEHCYVFRSVNYCKTFEEELHLLPIVLSKPIHVKIENLISTSNTHLKYKTLPPVISGDRNLSGNMTHITRAADHGDDRDTTDVSSLTLEKNTRTASYSPQTQSPPLPPLPTTTTPPLISSSSSSLIGNNDEKQLSITTTSAIHASQESVQQLEKYLTHSLDELKQLADQVQQSRLKLLQLKNN